jgi:hypothetical protein
VDCEILLIVPFFIFFSFFGFFNQSYDFSRKSLSEYLMDTIDFNEHDINIFINLAKIVRYNLNGRHWDESCNEWRLLLNIYFDGNFPNVKMCPYDKNMSTLNTYCGIFSTCHDYRKIIMLIEFFAQVNQARWDQRLCNQSKNSIIRWLACNR